MNPTPTSSNADANRPIGLLCGAIDELKETYLDGPEEGQKFFLGSDAPTGENNLKHLALHKLQYNLLEECKVLSRALYGLNDAPQANYLVYKLIHQYYDIYKYCTPVQFICEQANCKVFANNSVRIIQLMKRCIAHQ